MESQSTGGRCYCARAVTVDYCYPVGVDGESEDRMEPVREPSRPAETGSLQGEQRRVAEVSRHLQLTHQPLERHVLMRVSAERRLPHTL